MFESRSGLVLPVPDFYTVNKARQPKKDIGDYIESQGIPVPRRFKDLDEALSSGCSFLLRSEHPQDYDGVSNLLMSFLITADKIRENQAKYGTEAYEIEWGIVPILMNELLIMRKIKQLLR